MARSLYLVPPDDTESGPQLTPRRPPMFRRFRKSQYRDKHGKGPGTPPPTPWWKLYDGTE